MEQVANPARRRLFKGRVNSLASTPKLRLPWVISEQVFVEQCTQCNACVDNCETKIIKKDDFGFPYVDFSQDECTFCNQCQSHCEQPLFIDKTEQSNTLPWHASISISDKCLAENNIYCQSCRDVCDSRAIKFSYSNGPIPTPDITLSDCSQCGACVSTCPQNAIAIQIKEVI
ncbi:ferredoxin-type protein NapF [Thalassotalea euphylliae]|uniref:ferredoxin-type protein NapF n=1 Tax=Thalassotalea euphylliae TaxID=1655234 RepID=UPI003639A5CA